MCTWMLILLWLGTWDMTNSDSFVRLKGTKYQPTAVLFLEMARIFKEVMEYQLQRHFVAYFSVAYSWASVRKGISICRYKWSFCLPVACQEHHMYSLPGVWGQKIISYDGSNFGAPMYVRSVPSTCGVSQHPMSMHVTEWWGSACRQTELKHPCHHGGLLLGSRFSRRFPPATDRMEGFGERCVLEGKGKSSMESK